MEDIKRKNVFFKLVTKGHRGNANVEKCVVFVVWASCCYPLLGHTDVGTSVEQTIDCLMIQTVRPCSPWVWLSTPACAIVAVGMGKALKDAHGALKGAKQSARPCDPLLLKIAQCHDNQSRLWSRLHTTLAQITRITPMWIYTQYTVLEIFSPFRIFEQLALALKKRVCPEIFHCIEYILCIQDFWATCVCPKHKVALKICTALNISSL